MADINDGVRVGYAGKAYIGAVGATAPTTLTAAPDADEWFDLGKITEDGLTEATDQARSEFKAWGFDSPVRTQLTSKTTSFQLAFMQSSNAYVQSLFHSVSLADMTTTGTGDAAYTSFTIGQNTEPDVRALLLDIVDGAFATRIIVPRVEVTERGNKTYKGSETVNYPLTFTALTSSDGSSVRYMMGGLILPVVTP
ncbi:phage tail tube protein [[Kitasatospora] papulosa]|uniref:phage tail tube protein n=1 Tax=[Kitasatospora] papulosa TaxID=1464011 RepID=UPI0036D196B8